MLRHARAIRKGNHPHFSSFENARGLARLFAPRDGGSCSLFYRGFSAHAIRAPFAAFPQLSLIQIHAINSQVTSPAILLDSVEKSFPPTRSGWRTFLQPFEKPTVTALAGISLEVREGEAMALLGANGAGKSTILKILATLLLPTRGRAFLSGHDTVKNSRDVRRLLGYHAGTDHGFYPRLTGRANLLFFGRLNQLSAAAASARISTLADQFHLAEALDRQIR